MKDLNSCSSKHLKISAPHALGKAWVQAKGKITELYWKVNAKCLHLVLCALTCLFSCKFMRLFIPPCAVGGGTVPMLRQTGYSGTHVLVTYRWVLSLLLITNNPLLLNPVIYLVFARLKVRSRHNSVFQ